jgi:hypothetical protein
MKKIKNSLTRAVNLQLVTLIKNKERHVRSVAFPVTEYNEILSGYWPGQVVE